MSYIILLIIFDTHIWLIMNLKDKVIAEIKKIYDPEIPVNIYELGLIYDIKIDEKPQQWQ